LQIHQSPRGIFINQARYTLEILHKHGMDKGQSIGTPIATKPKLDADLSGNPVDQTDYRSKIGSLMYLTSSRPDIVQATKIELTLEQSQQGVSNDVLVSIEGVEEVKRNMEILLEPTSNKLLVETNQFVPPTVDSHSLFLDLNEEPVTNPLLDHIQYIFHRHIIRLNNVKGDGNCGFWSVAAGRGRDENMWSLIRQELLQELRYHAKILTSTGFKFIWDTVNFFGTGFAPMDKWMSMPDTRLVIASFYRRPLVSISMVENVVLSSTRFLLWSGPHESESTEPIVVARVGAVILLIYCYEQVTQYR
nr:hypothetical protein [Tanacetum cinerariifolium]